jgi:hypothetical protein
MAVTEAFTSYWLWGTLAWGDFADLTIYKGHRCQIVVFAKTWPDKPPSPFQLARRALFKAAAVSWEALSPAARAQWELATRRASLTMHGWNLFLHWKLTGDDKAIETLERQTGTTLLPP